MSRDVRQRDFLFLPQLCEMFSNKAGCQIFLTFLTKILPSTDATKDSVDNTQHKSAEQIVCPQEKNRKDI